MGIIKSAFKLMYLAFLILTQIKFRFSEQGHDTQNKRHSFKSH